MNRYNKNESNVDFAVDIELLRIEKLIYERETYEEGFFSLEPPKEFDYRITQYPQDIKNPEMDSISGDFEIDLINAIEYEENLMQLRDEKLIQEREDYESNMEIVLDDFALNDFYDYQIEAREEEEFLERNGYDYDFKYEPEFDYEYDQYEEEMFWNLHYLRESQFAAPECGCAYLDYMPNDDGLCDYLDCYDYPEGPDENLNGIKYC